MEVSRFIWFVVLVLGLLGGCVSYESGKITIDIGDVSKSTKQNSAKDSCETQLKINLDNKVKKGSVKVLSYGVIESKQFSGAEETINYITSYEDIKWNAGVIRSINKKVNSIKHTDSYLVSAGEIEYGVALLGINRMHYFVVCDDKGVVLTSIGF